MADNLRKQPRKGILKNSSSFEGNERQKESVLVYKYKVIIIMFFQFF